MSGSKINYLFYGLLACFWSGSYIGIKIVVDNMPAIWGAAVRVTIAFLVLSILFLLMRKKLSVPFSLVWKMWLTGIAVQAIPFAFLFPGEKYITPGLAGVINGSVPIWAYIFSLIVFRDASLINWRKIFGSLGGMLGIVLICYPTLYFSGNKEAYLGIVMVLIMAISYAGGGIANQYLFAKHPQIDFYANIFHQHYASLIFLIIVAFLFEGKIPITQILQFPVITASLYLGVFSTALAWLMYYQLIRDWGIVRAITVTYLFPVLALLWDYLFFKNVPHWIEILGVGVVLLSVITIQYNAKQKR